MRIRDFKASYKKDIIDNFDDDNYNCDIEVEEENENMKTIVINGMACNHCKMTVEKVLGAVEGIEKVEVNLEEKIAKVSLTKDVENDVLKSVVEEAGFEVVEIKE